ncbi:sugar MFS transporter [Sediminitomix flava]|uniref:FHS family L-fucose permease-like MFS transporter n=1 Tax=Sediminitomix flava TaxID=379075 RepID=A0A316A078_SEDFL|nr:sugar MFS transporter [Sediminitomix flava]PWJ43047.1 FHS family L-fucose permease-like MFS transporter [Sediminitomix flava]
MAIASSTVETRQVKESPEGTNYRVPLTLMVILFFMVGFITVLNDVLIPSLKNVFSLNTWQAMLIQFCFFGAYGVMSIPSGLIIKKIGYKKGLALALTIIGIGLLLFVPASITVVYSFFLFALFTVASGLALLQVAINPYIIALGPEKTGASRLNLGGAMNSTATTIGPIIGGAFILKELSLADFQSLHPTLEQAKEALKMAQAAAVQGPYIALALVTIGIGVVLFFLNLPQISSEEESKEKAEGSVLAFRNLLYGAGAIFFYVGVEVAIGSILILYLAEEYMGGISEKLASSLLAYYWGSAMIGRFAGSYLGQRFQAQKMLRVVTLVAIAFVALSFSSFALENWVSIPAMVMETTGGFSIHFEQTTIPYAGLFLILCGLCNSVMWPCIFPLGISGLGKHTSLGSGIMCTMICGGAFIPLAQGWLEGEIGYTWSFILPLACYFYILFFAIEGYKPIKLKRS